MICFRDISFVSNWNFWNIAEMFHPRGRGERFLVAETFHRNIPETYLRDVSKLRPRDISKKCFWDIHLQMSPRYSVETYMRCHITSHICFKETSQRHLKEMYQRHSIEMSLWCCHETHMRFHNRIQIAYRNVSMICFCHMISFPTSW